MGHADKDTLLATLVSLLEPASFPQELYIASLERAKWDVAAAAEDLLLRGEGEEAGSSSSAARGVDGFDGGERKLKKRKVTEGGLRSWLSIGRESRAESKGKGKRIVEREDSGQRTRNDGDEVVQESTQIPVAPTDISNSSKHYESNANFQPRRPNLSPTKRPLVSLSTLLRPPDSSSTPSSIKSLPRLKSKPLPALLLTPTTLPSHALPLALLRSPLDPPFASALYLTMMRESEKWEKNRWYLAGRMVESGHTMASYARKNGGYGGRLGVRYFYSGNEYDVNEYPEMLARAAEMVEVAVNEHLDRSPRYPLEWKGRWRANVCGANRYDGAASSVGWHADQLTYLGPYATIASLSLGTPRAFRVRQTAAADDDPSQQIRTYEINLGHNSLCLMTAGCQERFKHTVPPQKALDLFRPAWDEAMQPIAPENQKASTSRINITFRFYREDFHPDPQQGPFGLRQGTPICKCGIPTLLRADQKAKARSRLEGGKKVHHEAEVDESATQREVEEDLRKDDELDDSSRKRQSIEDDTVVDDAKVNGVKAIETEASEEQSKTGPPVQLVDDDMAYFWQCQSPAQTGDMKGCGFFRLLDMRAEGRGPCVSW